MNYQVFSLLIILISALSVKGQPLPSKKEQYDFLKWYAKNVKLIGLCDTLQSIDTKELFQNSRVTLDDRIFIRKQLALIENSIILDTLTIKGPIWKGHKDLIPGTYLSNPVFGKSKRLVFIHRLFYCGELCGHSEIEVYLQKKNGSWRKSSKYYFPISEF